MKLVTLRDVLGKAEKGGYAVGLLMPTIWRSCRLLSNLP